MTGRTPPRSGAAFRRWGRRAGVRWCSAPLRIRARRNRKLARKQIGEFQKELAVPKVSQARHIPAHFVIDDVDIASGAIDEVEPRARAPLVGRRVVLGEGAQRHVG